MIKPIISVILVTLLTACASPYPLGMNKEQWQALSADERKALLLEQQKYREEQRLAQIKADAKTRQLEIKQQMAEQARLEKLYNQPQGGNVIMINLLAGEYQRGKRSKTILEESYQVARGETKRIELKLQDRKRRSVTSETAYLHYAQNGNAVYLYLDNPRYDDDHRIALLRDGHWHCGSQYQKNLYSSYEELRGVKLFVKEIGSLCHRNNRMIDHRYPAYR